MSTPRSHPRDPLHGISLANILHQLVERHGWTEMGRRIPIRCFLFNPSVKSSLTFLRKTPWARQKVEMWFILELPEPRPAGPAGTPETPREPSPPPGDSPPVVGEGSPLDLR